MSRAGAVKNDSVGARVGVFSIRYLSDDEVILGDCDMHPDVQVSVHKAMRGQRQTVSISTVAHVHNRLGRMYMPFAAPRCTG